MVSYQIAPCLQLSAYIQLEPSRQHRSRKVLLSATEKASAAIDSRCLISKEGHGVIKLLILVSPFLVTPLIEDRHEGSLARPAQDVQDAPALEGNVTASRLPSLLRAM
jgi:hypothetical protein